MIANIDCDLLLYEVGSYCNDEGIPLEWPLCKNRADAKIKKITEAAECDDYKLFLTGQNNFRIAEGTILPYKGHRVSPKPANHANLLRYFSTSENFKGRVNISEGCEADDMLGICQTSETVLCSRDKDLKQVPGKHYSWGTGLQKEQGLFVVTEEEGINFFFQQLLTGDMTDNIRGLYKVGAVAAKKLLLGLTEPLSLYSVVQHQYEVRFGSYWRLFMHENARLLWMLQTPDDDIRVWLDALEQERQEATILDEVF